MKAGFTGSQEGMTSGQSARLSEIIAQLSPTEFHHGDCIGADEQAHTIVRSLTKAKIIIHPPENVTKRAYCEGDIILKPEDYLTRNRAIVAATDCLIATPNTKYEVVRSGTWSTVRYATRFSRVIHLLLP